MSKVIDQERFTRELFDVLDETFETPPNLPISQSPNFPITKEEPHVEIR